MHHPTRTARSITLALCALMLLTVALSGCRSDQTIKIGFVGQLTGSGAWVGQVAEIALKDRIDEINAAGGINGYRLKLISYDSRSEVPDAVAAVKRLIEQDKVAAIIGPEWSAAAIPIAAIADESQVPIITTTATHVNVTVDEEGDVHPYMFRVCFIDPYQGYALADFAYRELGARKAAFITDVASPYSVGIQDFFEAQFSELGGEIVAKEGYQSNDQEFRAQISNVMQTDADLLVIPTAQYRDAALIARQGVDLGLDIQYLGVDGWVANELLDMAGAELEGAYLSSGVSTESPEFADYNAQFEAKHGKKATVFAYYALDALALLEHAIGIAGPDREGIRDALENAVDVPAFSSNITIEPDTHNPHNKPIVVMQIRDSQWQIVKTYSPGE
ncbi:MAG: ABC transporter substrate-binding protein [Anaerolineae bacterium]|jgi:branched-chain amino acid transport system substrate-binding protein